jgi:hypothetical protein
MNCEFGHCKPYSRRRIFGLILRSLIVTRFFAGLVIGLLVVGPWRKDVVNRLGV